MKQSQGGAVGSSLGSYPRGREFESRPCNQFNNAGVALKGEQRFCKPMVEGSNPSFGSI